MTFNYQQTQQQRQQQFRGTSSSSRAIPNSRNGGQQQLPTSSAIGINYSGSYREQRSGPPPTTNNVLKSQSIPISGAHRTASEVQLCEDEALADYRDYVVFSRIVNHMDRQRQSKQQQLLNQEQHSNPGSNNMRGGHHQQQHQQQHHNPYLQQENEKCLAHILSTRSSNVSSSAGQQQVQQQQQQQDTLQSLSQHIAQSQAGNYGATALDDYYCGEEAPSNSNSNGWILSADTSALSLGVTQEQHALEVDEEDEEIFAMEL